MKKKGFTLIELLAVIVVLALIALISMPIILNVIKSAKEKAFIDSAYGVLEATEYYYARKSLGLAYNEDNVLKPLIYKQELALATLDDNNNINNDSEIQTISNTQKDLTKITFPDNDDLLKIKGKEPDGGIVYIKNRGSIALSLWNEELQRCAVKKYEEIEITLASPQLTREECEEGNIVESNQLTGMIWDGWITLSLFYPENSTERKWRLGEAGDVREEDWNEYEGSITIPLKDIENIWIKYKINGKIVVVPPKGTLWVDIVPSSYTIKSSQTVSAKIYSEDGAEIYYKTGSEWKKYNESTNIQLTTSGIIEAKAIKNENVYNSDGTLAYTRKVTVYDSIFIRNYGTPVGKTESSNGDSSGGTSSGGTSSGSNIIRDSSTGKIIPSYYIAGPTISVSPTTTTTSVTVTLTTPETSRKTYIKVGNNSYQEYTEPITVDYNTSIYAYYIRDTDGAYSSTSYKQITNIRQLGYQCTKPYISISTDPSLNKKYVDEMKVSIESDGDKLEYSYNGVEYYDYSNSLKIKENKRIYARAKNSCGVVTDYIDITNFDSPPTMKNKLNVDIIVNPEPSLSTSYTKKVKITINYDAKATKKYYRIGTNNALKEYTEPIIVEENTTVYAYALNETGYGEASKRIDNIGETELTTIGISEPKINVNPNNSVLTSSVSVTIEYDKNATVKQYRIGNGSLQNYTGTFTVDKNTTIYAVNSDSNGNTKDTIYKIQNINKVPVYMINYGDYFIIKLNYPEVSKENSREYKYQANGTWKKYKSDGILLVIDSKINTDGVIKIKDENGREKIFNGTVEYINGPISEIMENLYMRWDTKKPDTPNIVLNPTDATKKVDVTITYDSTCKIKEYKVVEPNGISSEFVEYKNSFIITKKNSVIYARCMNQSEMYSDTAIKKITNIDEDSPVINLSADLETKTRELKVSIIVTDDVSVDTVMYTKGKVDKEYFKTSGNLISNNSILKITENGIYTFYAKDGVGNEKIEIINVENVDTSAPNITISESPDNTLGLESTISIDFGDAVTKKYKIGKNTTTWTTYTDKFSITSYTLLSNNLQNNDYSYTICAQGIDSTGNVEEVCNNFYNLDLDAPSVPEIISNAGYPVLSKSGVNIDGTTIIKYDNRTDIINYYSLDGTTWKTYTGSFEVTTGVNIYAKSVKKSTGLEMSTTMTISVPSDALPTATYDGNTGTGLATPSKYTGFTRYINVNPDMWGQNGYVIYKINCFAVVKTHYYNGSSLIRTDTLRSVGGSGDWRTETRTFTIPTNTTRMAVSIDPGSDSKGYLLEIGAS